MLTTVGCLDGIVVLDLARRYPGAFTAMVLGDFGADVIKVDPPGSNPFPLYIRVSEEFYAAHFAADRNKRSIQLDLRDTAGQEIFYRLTKRADVLIEGFRPGVTERLRIDYPRLAALNPSLVYCSLSGFGRDGPYAKIPAHDINYNAIAGALSLIGERNGRPYLPSNLIADYGGAAMHGIVGVLLALFARERNRKGQFVDIAYLDSVVALLTGHASGYFTTGVVPKRGEHRFTGSAPHIQVFRCKDDEYFTIGAAEPHYWANLCRALGREDLISGFSPSTRERSDEVIAELAAVFATRTRDEWYEYLRDKETCVGPVNNLDEAFQDPQLLHRQMLVEKDHPAFGKVKQVGIAIKLSDTPGSVRKLGVPTGSDTQSVLADLGLGPQEIAALREKGVIG